MNQQLEGMVEIIKYCYITNIIYIYVQTSGRAACHKNGQGAGMGWPTVVSMLEPTGVSTLGSNVGLAHSGTMGLAASSQLG